MAGELSAPVEALPLAARAPVQAPDALQAVALAETQLKVEEAPLATAPEARLKVTVGATLTMTLAAGLVPAEPVQVRL